MQNISLIEQVGWRFVEAGLSSAFATAAVVTFYTGITTWEQFSTASGALGLAFLIGFINGVIQAGRKYFSGATVSVDSTMPEALVQ